MSRAGTDWESIALWGVGAVVAYELLAKAKPKPAAPAAPKAPAAPGYAGGTSATTSRTAGGGLTGGGGWLSSPALTAQPVATIPVQTVGTTWTQPAVTPTVTYRPTASVIMPTTTVAGVRTPTIATQRFIAAQQARLDAQDVAAALPTVATQPIPPMQQVDVPSGTDYGNLASFQSQISQTTYQQPAAQPAAQTAAEPTYSSPAGGASEPTNPQQEGNVVDSLPTVATQEIPDVQPADEPVYTPPVFSDEPVDYGDPTQFRRGGE